MLELDDKAWQLLGALQADGRQPLKALAAAAGLSIAATAERLKKLQDSGVIKGVHAELDAARAGWGVRAIIGITVLQPGKRGLLQALRALPEVLECHHVTGADSYLLTVLARDLSDLERLLGCLNLWGETRTSVVLSTPIERRGLAPPRPPAATRARPGTALRTSAAAAPDPADARSARGAARPRRPARPAA